ncbi:uncharacterized protein DUF3225 [Jatrophihabitans sp. GAS493]|uniref:AtzH-like domain-containing protein n=1 Tax=Jatrophihabitans sp. GAS493 TaxID=1907575 RepID=UPI000BB7F577|nr:AtzH-like domain-containing protein [Jatrophihabitans sp. GAS493]SOD71916.1 uncharacterized protein DUF3225 [Jatrophihabitans sp. GAS493]
MSLDSGELGAPTSEVVASTVLEAFASYEKALSDHDVETMNEFFSDSTEIVRFGIADEEWGVEQLRAWRAAAPPVPAGRTLASTQVQLVTDRSAVVTTLFRYPGRSLLGRQTQVWACLGGPVTDASSWRIVNAHVSEREEQR